MTPFSKQLVLATVILSTSWTGVTAQATEAPPDGILIDSVIIENRNIYDTNEENYDKFLFKLANKFHIKTRKHVIARELLLSQGDPFATDLAEETERNLRKNLKVYDAWIETQLLPSGKLLMRVVTIDQWSLTGGLSYSREGNETRYQIGAEEENFLGNNQFVSFYYFAQSDDEDFAEARFFDNRFLGKPYRVQLAFSDDPIGSIRGFTVSRPYYDLKQDFSFLLSAGRFGGRRDIYSDSLKIGESMFDGDLVESAIAYRLGPPDQKLSFVLSHTYRFEDNYDRKVLSLDSQNIPLALAGFPEDSLYHQVNVETEYSRFNFVQLRNIDGFGYTEDYVLGHFAGIEYGRAFQADFKGYHYDRTYARLSRYLLMKSNLVLLDYGHMVWFRGSSTLRHYTALTGKYYSKITDQVTLAFRANYTSDWDVSGRNTLVLGGTTGIRGYNKFFRTGDRRVVFNAETRFFTGLSLLSATFGGAVFADFGSVYKPDQPLDLSSLYAAGGVGLRIALAKSTRNIVRIDLAYSRSCGWELSIGTDQYFLVQP